MRTIDPFLLPGLWSGGFQADRSISMAAGRLASPPKRSAVIEPFAAIAQRPLRALEATSLQPGFHAWFGHSGRRMICSVFAARSGSGDTGLPDFLEAIVLGVRTSEECYEAVAIFAITPERNVQKEIKAAITAGAREWHVHLPAPGMRDVLLKDFERD